MFGKDIDNVEVMNHELIKIKYTDGWHGFEPNKYFWTKKWKEWYGIEIVDENPDIVITHGFSYDFLHYWCPRVLISGECFIPDMNLVDYAVSLCPIDCEGRAMRWPFWLSYEDDVTAALKKHMMTIDEGICNRKFCSFVVSNNRGAEERTEIFEKLNTYKTVDSGGRYLNNVGGPVKDKKGFVSKYKFSIVYENAQSTGYITEKMIQAFAAGTIPLYWGAPDIEQEFNPDSFINCNGKSTDEILNIVKDIDNNKQMYAEMLKSPIFQNNSRGKKYYDNNYEIMKKFWDQLFVTDRLKVKRNNTCYGKFYENEIRKAYDQRRGLKERACNWIGRHI